MKILQSFPSFYVQEQCWHSAPLDNEILLCDEEMKGVLDDGKGYPTSFKIQHKPFCKTLKIHMPTFRKL